MEKLHQRKLDTIKEFTDYRVESMQSGKYHLYRNFAKFISEIRSSSTMEIALKASISSSRPDPMSQPPIPGIYDSDIWTSDDVLDLATLPESIIVLGGGVVACELAQFLHRVGAKTTQIQRSHHILKDHAPDVSEVVETALRDGLDLSPARSSKASAARRMDSRSSLTSAE